MTSLPKHWENSDLKETCHIISVERSEQKLRKNVIVFLSNLSNLELCQKFGTLSEMTTHQI